MEPADTLRIAEPFEWFVVFDRTTRLWWLRLLPGFKHVMAFGYCPVLDIWLVYNVVWSGTRITAMPHDQPTKDALTLIMSAGETIRIAPPRHRPHPLSRVGFTCVAAVTHLLGLRCVAVTPTRLYRFLLSNGGTLIRGPAGHPSTSA